MNPHGKYGIGAQVAVIMDNEGGYTDHPADRGGPTNAGVTVPAWREYCADTGRNDAEHKFAPVMDDFAFAMQATRRVMFHDYQPSFPGVVEACDKIKEAVGGDWYYVKKFAAWDGTK